jgi:rsbT antagonist protein RsbS
MTVPILKQRDVLVASVQSVLTDEELIEMEANVSEMIGRHRSRAVIIDVGALDVLDSFGTRTLRSIAHVAKFRGADAVVVGIQPEVAFAMVRMGLGLEGIDTALDLDEALDRVEAR